MNSATDLLQWTIKDRLLDAWHADPEAWVAIVRPVYDLVWPVEVEIDDAVFERDLSP